MLGFIVEKVTGKTLDEYMYVHLVSSTQLAWRWLTLNFRQENIFNPLGIRASFYLSPDLKEKNLPLTIRDSGGKLQTFQNQPGFRMIPQEPSQGPSLACYHLCDCQG